MTRFFKGHGLGNDYLALELPELKFELTPPAIRLICDRHLGVGSDGILARTGSEVASFGLRIFNPDGSEAEKSGNGLRIFAAFLLATVADMRTGQTPDEQSAKAAGLGPGGVASRRAWEESRRAGGSELSPRRWTYVPQRLGYFVDRVKRCRRWSRPARRCRPNCWRWKWSARPGW